MSFWPFPRLYRPVLILMAALMMLTVFSPLALADDEAPPDMNFGLDFVKDVNDNYIITVGCNNNTLGSLGSVFATLPLDSRLEYQYYVSSNANSYVRRGVPERLEVQFGKVDPGACSPVQIYFKRVPNSRGTWTVTATGHWDGEPTSNGVQSNAVSINLNGGPGTTVPGTLAGGGEVHPGNSVPFTGVGYYANELVSLWLNLADGRAVPLSGSSTIYADSQGHIAFTLVLASDIPLGATSVVAYGQSSKITKVGFMTVVPS